MNTYGFKILRLKNEVDRDMKKLSIEIRMATKEIDELNELLNRSEERGNEHEYVRESN